MKKFLIIGLIFGVAWYFWRKAQAAKSFIYDFGLPKNFKLTGSIQNFDINISFVLPLTITNTFSASVRVTSITLVVSGYGTKFSTIQHEGFTVSSNDETTVDLNVSFQLYAAIISIFRGLSSIEKTKNIELNFSGYVIGEGLINVPVNQDVTLPITLKSLLGNL